MSHHFFLLRELVKRDFQGRYAGSILGFFWSFVQPLFLLGLYYFVFGLVLRVPLVGTRTDNFAFLLFAGLLPWMAFQEGVMRGATAVTDNANLVKKLTFPSEILVLTVVLAGCLHEGIAGLVFVAVVGGSGQLTVAQLPLLLVALPLQVALTLGLALILAALNVLFRDTSQVLGMVLAAWFFLTPIVYPRSLLGEGVPAVVRQAIELNPMTTLVDLYRAAFFGGAPVPWSAVGGLAITAAVLLSVGFWVFRRLKPVFVDEM